jgi:hypothetical protein
MTNHGLYTDVAWAVPVLFTDEAGEAIDLSGSAFVLQLIDRAGSVAFTFRSSGNASNEGAIDTTQAASGRLSFTATETQHAAVAAGLYRAHLYVDATDDLWQAVGKALIGTPGEAQTYLEFESVNDGGAATVSGTVTIRLVTSTAAFDGGSANSDFSTGPSLDLGRAS